MNAAAAALTAVVLLGVLIGVLLTAPGPMPSCREVVVVIAVMAGTSILIGILTAGPA